MRQSAHKSFLIAFSTACIVLFMIGMTLPIASTSAQRDRPTRTPRAGEGSRPNLQITPRATTERSDLAATVEALKDLSSLNPEALQATAQAVIDKIPALEGEFTTEDLSAWVESLSAAGSLSFDRDAGTLTFTAQLDENTANMVIDEALTSAGYAASSVSVNFVNGYIVVTATDVSVTNQISGTVVTTVGLTVVDGEVVADIIGATVNGQPMPAAMVDAWETAIHEAFSALPADTPYEYSVDQIAVTDDAVVITMTIVLPVAE